MAKGTVKVVVDVEKVADFDFDFNFEESADGTNKSVEERLSALLAISLRERFNLSDNETKTVYDTALRNIRKRKDWDWLSGRDCRKEFIDFRTHLFGAFRKIRKVEDGERYDIVSIVSYESFIETIYSDNPYRNYSKEMDDIIG